MADKLTSVSISHKEKVQNINKIIPHIDVSLRVYKPCTHGDCIELGSRGCL